MEGLLTLPRIREPPRCSQGVFPNIADAKAIAATLSFFSVCQITYAYGPHHNLDL